MDKTDHQRRQEQMSWVDYCDSLSNEHSWPKMQVRPAFHISDRLPDAAVSSSRQRETSTELT